MDNQVSENYLSITQAAKHLGVARQTVSRWVHNGLPHERIGRSVLIPKNVLENRTCPTCGRKWNSRVSNANMFDV